MRILGLSLPHVPLLKRGTAPLTSVFGRRDEAPLHASRALLLGTGDFLTQGRIVKSTRPGNPARPSRVLMSPLFSNKMTLWSPSPDSPISQSH